MILSYIIPCYNVQDYLPRCLLSLASQKYRGDSEIEFVLVNDGSTDSTLSLLREFERKEHRAVVIDQTNQGVSAARNAGLKVAKGKYVFFLDGDDWLTDDASDIICELSQNGTPDILLTNAYIVNDEQRDSKSEWNICSDIDTGLYETIEFTERVKYLPISFKTYRREMLVENNVSFAEDLKVGEVYAFFINALTYSQYIAYTDKRVMNYLVRKNSVMRTVNLERDSTIIKTIHQVDEYARAQMPYLLDMLSYQLGLYSIVKEFGIFNYAKKTAYTQEVGDLLEKIRHDKLYRKALKCHLYKNIGINLQAICLLIIYLLPVFISFRLLRIKYKLESN